MKIHEVEQGSVDWEILRSGKVTASEMDALITPLGAIRKGEMPKTYLAGKLAERWIGGPLPSLYEIFDIEQGRLLEERARPAFTLHTGIEVDTVGFIETDDGNAGCSPDALIGRTSGVEIKCPRLETHIGYLLAGELPRQYVAQVQGSMFVTGFERWHFFSYRHSFPPLHVVVERDEKFQEALGEAIETFTEKLGVAWARLVELNGGPPKRSKPTPAAPPKQPYISTDIIP